MQIICCQYQVSYKDLKQVLYARGAPNELSELARIRAIHSGILDPEEQFEQSIDQGARQTSSSTRQIFWPYVRMLELNINVGSSRIDTNSFIIYPENLQLDVYVYNLGRNQT